MARSRSSDVPQLTLEDWAEALAAQPAAGMPATGNESTIALLAEALAPKIAEELCARLPRTRKPEPPNDRLLTLDEFVAELPSAKRPETWKRWLYERTRRGEIPGCVKLGGMLFFERERAIAWFRAGAAAR